MSELATPERVQPQYDDYFETGSLFKQARRRNPYDFAQTYHLMRGVFGYDKHYVNFGYWPDGLATEEPGRRLALLMGEKLGLHEGARLIEGGSGLGQCAVDLTEHFNLDRVQGINPCEPQVAFASALASAHKLDQRVVHTVADACTFVDSLADDGFTHAMAMECIGHFPDPVAFLTSVRRALPSGGRMCFTLVTSPTPPSAGLQWFQKLFFGVVPQHGQAWADRLTEAGFVNVQREDITGLVFRPVIDFSLQRLREEPELMARFTAPQRMLLVRFLKAASRAIDKGRMGYDILVGEVP